MKIFSNLLNKRHRTLSRIVRVNHAGEMCAKYIYMGQIMIIKDKTLEEMLSQEMKHLDYFEKKSAIENTRTSMLAPLCKFGGLAAGITSAILGRNFAMALTVGVENVIESHYKKQLEELEFDNIDQDLKDKIVEFLKDEQTHRDTAHNEGGSYVNDKYIKSIEKITKCAIKAAEII